MPLPVHVSAMTMKTIRFGFGSRAASPLDVAAEARGAEAAGFSTIGFGDHFNMPVAPLLGLQAAAAVTSDLRLTTTVLGQDFRHPAVLAKEIATLDVLSGGRLEIGVGAGWLQADYDLTGIPFDPPGQRIDRLAEYVEVLRGLLSDEPLTYQGAHYSINQLDGVPKPLQRPWPPFVIGGGRQRVLRYAGRVADIVSIITSTDHRGSLGLGPAELSAAQLQTRIDWVAEGAGDRFDHVELNIPILGLAIASDPRAGAEALIRVWSRMGLDVADIVASPMFLTGTVEEVAEKVVGIRDRFGVSYFAVNLTTIEAFAPVITAVRDAAR